MNLGPKLDYSVREIKGDLEEFKKFPQFFSFSLERKIKPRHRMLVEYGLKMPLSRMLKVNAGEFNARLFEMLLRMVEERNALTIPNSTIYYTAELLNFLIKPQFNMFHLVENSNSSANSRTQKTKFYKRILALSLQLFGHSSLAKSLLAILECPFLLLKRKPQRMTGS
ncbi:hypothetical protein NC651_020121 [Populus alba x Populus x berolinensis]|nr:hypothetical protein NC651_020121 [Populus alba x Populus x berolinensis]